MVLVSLGELGGLVIGTVEGYLVILSLGLPLGSPIGYPNLRAVLPVPLLSAPIGLLFGYEAFIY